MRELVLASSSRYRAELLARLGIPFESRAPEIDESALPGEDAGELVVRLACEKATAVAAHYPDALIIGSDQLAVCGTELLGKPGTEERARAQLTALSGRTVTFLTGLCLLDAASVESQSALVTTPVRFRRLEVDEIADYVAREQPLDCAGAFKSEGLGIALFDAIGGEDPTALIGLPLIALCRMLRAAGLPVLDSASSD
ncbi:MAG: Maf family protein [Pseudomonadales bacterium]